MIAIAAILPGSLAMGVRDWWSFTALWSLIVLASSLSVVVSKPGWYSEALAIAILIVGTLASMCSTMAFGPLLLMPLVVVMTGLKFSAQPSRGLRRAGLWASGAAVLVPALLEWAGALPATYRFEDGSLRVVPHMLVFPSGLTHAVLLFGSLGVVLATLHFTGRMRQTLNEVEQRMFLQTWQLRQLVSIADVPPPAAPRRQGCDGA